MSGSNGSTTLTDDQCEKILAQFGEQYRAVETGVHGVGNSRKKRRKAGDRGHTAGIGKQAATVKKPQR